MDAPDFTHIILLPTSFLSVLRARNIAQSEGKKARECSKTIYPIIIHCMKQAKRMEIKPGTHHYVACCPTRQIPGTNRSVSFCPVMY